jgi:rod shape determining protein RodA
MSRRENIFKYLDWLTILIYLALVFFGWTIIIAVGYKGDSFRLFDFGAQHGKQLIWIGISLILGFFLLVVDYKFYLNIGFVYFGLMMVVLAATLVLAPEVKGARSWFMIGPFTFQPSEFAKSATVLALVTYLTRINVNIHQNKTRLISVLIILFPTALIVLQGDTGSALVFLGLFLLLFREGFPVILPLLGIYVLFLFLITVALGPLYMFIGLAVGLLPFIVLNAIKFKYNKAKVFLLSGVFIVSSLFVWFGVDAIFYKVFKPHQQTRINVLLGKEYGAGADYNVMQSKIAIGSGGLQGKGYLKGTLTKGEFVPEQSTDFIFSTLGEELGFIGSAAFILLFLTLLLRIIYLSERQRSKFTLLYGYGVAAILFVHFAINVGMAIGIVPVVGIPLPFLSYGGSSLIGFTILIFILLKLDANRKTVFR